MGFGVSCFGRWLTSLSARRAWIEMSTAGAMIAASVSLSARRAWIEICVKVIVGGDAASRSPQGERG